MLLVSMGKPLNGTVSALFGSPALRVIGSKHDRLV